MIIARIAQIIILSVPVILFSWLLRQELIPSGSFIVSRSVDEISPFIDQLLPEIRVEEVGEDTDGDLVQGIIDDPVFFFVHPHRGFDSIETQIWFKNDSVPIIEFGGLAQEQGQIYDLKPLQNLLIDDSDWSRLEKNGVTLLQREYKYETVADFLVDPPDRHEIATYHYSLTRPYIIDGYSPSSEIQEIDVSLRGFHQFKTYIKDESLNFRISYMDMNRAEGPDGFSVIVFNEAGEPVGSSHALDDKNTSDNAEPSDLNEIEINIPDLPEGVYKIELRAERDIFFRLFETTQQKVVFLNNLYLGDDIAWKDVSRPVSFWTQAKHLAFTTQHASGVQEVQIGSGDVAVDDPYERYQYNVPEDGVVKVVVPKSDMIVHTDGHIAFAPEQFFNPDPVRLREYTDLDALGVNYVIANYTSPRKQGNWTVANATFDTKKLFMDEGSWKFTFSTPSISDFDGRVDIGKIEMVWKRSPFELSELVDAIKNRL